MKNPLPTPRQLKATYAALYALGEAIPEGGIDSGVLFMALQRQLDLPTFNGLVDTLVRGKIASKRGKVLDRGPEFADGLERLRLAGQGIRTT